MGQWEFFMLREKDGEWVLWTRGSLEDCLDSLFEFRQGQYSGFSRARIEIGASGG